MEVSETTVRLFLLLVAQEGIAEAQNLMQEAGIAKDEIQAIMEATNTFVFNNPDDNVVDMASAGEETCTATSSRQ